MTRAVSRLSALLLFLRLLAPQEASAKTGPLVLHRNPIDVASCEILRTGAPAVHVRGLRIRFRNMSLVAADTVGFRVLYRGERRNVTDAGRFAPYVTIEHTFDAFSGMLFAGSKADDCALRYARFVDGRIWRSPEPANTQIRIQR